jgi:multicomponent Na+:H+ antiporter subunit D
VCNAFLAGDLFNLFVGFEILLSASFVLLTLGASQDRVRAGIAYVMVSMVSSLIFLLGIALVYATTGSLNMAQIAVRIDTSAPAPGPRCSPSCWWRSGSRPRSSRCRPGCPTRTPPHPRPVTAVFAGLLTKVGVYAIIRAHSLLFPAARWTTC